jgi:hypothetical protein
VAPEESGAASDHYGPTAPELSHGPSPIGNTGVIGCFGHCLWDT